MNISLPLEELVMCVVCWSDRYICKKCVSNLCNYSWLQFIPLSWGGFQPFECLADSCPWMMHQSGDLYPIQRHRCSDTHTFSEKSGFSWDTKSYYLAASFSLVIESISHPFNIGFRFECCSDTPAMPCCPNFGKVVEELNQVTFLHVCHGFCWLLCVVQMNSKQKVHATMLPGNATHDGMSPLPLWEKRGLDLWLDILIIVSILLVQMWSQTGH